MSAKSGLSTESARVYDRQIRLWGARSQVRVQHARILVIGLSALAAEALKNLVLAGISDVVIVDWQTVGPGDLTHLFLDHSSLGKNRGEASLGRLGVLNPAARIVARPVPRPLDPTSFLSSLKSTLHQLDGESAERKESDGSPLAFDVVLATDLPSWEVLEALNSLARSQQTYRVARIATSSAASFGKGSSVETRSGGFVCAQAVGEGAFFFQDFGFHTFSKKIEGTDGGPSTEQSGDQIFAALTDSRASVVSSATRSTLHPLFFAFQALLNARGSSQRPDLDALQAQLCERYKIPASKVDKALLERLVKCFHSELPATTAVVGGFIGQEIIKFIAQNDQVLHNWFFYDAHTSQAIVESLL